MKMEHTMDLTWRVAPGDIFSTFHGLLAEGKIGATRCGRCGQVYLPPRPVCGDCYEPLTEWVEVADNGTIEAFTISYHPILDPVSGKPRPTPYASLLIKLDGASTSLNHYLVDADPRQAAIGGRVRAVWREPRTTLRDLMGFVLTEAPPQEHFPRPVRPPHPSPPPPGAYGLVEGRVREVVKDSSGRMPVHLNIPFAYAAGRAGDLFLNGLRKGEILGSRCDSCGSTTVPCRSFCARCFRRLGEEDLRKLGPEGVLAARAGAEKVALGLIRLRGADNLFLHRVASVPNGSRVTARFRAPGERAGQLLDIECFESMEDRS